jgi:hypothetical protein
VVDDQLRGAPGRQRERVDLAGGQRRQGRNPHPVRKLLERLQQARVGLLQSVGQLGGGQLGPGLDLGVALLPRRVGRSLLACDGPGGQVRHGIRAPGQVGDHVRPGPSLALGRLAEFVVGETGDGGHHHGRLALHPADVTGKALGRLGHGGHVSTLLPRYGLETMCIGGGQGLAAVFARIS